MLAEKISRLQARTLALTSQGLTSKNPFGKGKQAVVKMLQHLSYVQIDSISVIERAHHHVIWTRIPGYNPEMLDDLQTQERKVFEYWSHAAAYLPIEDFRFCLPRMQDYASGKKHWFSQDRAMMQEVLHRIKREGPLLAKDFQGTHKKAQGWWDWKPAKKALEQLFMEGKLLVVGRKNFQKVYDIAERVLPEGTNLQTPSKLEMAEYLVRRTLRAHGIAREKEMAYLRTGMQQEVKLVLEDLLQEGILVALTVKGLADEVYYAFADTVEALDKKKPKKRVLLLSPFDNFIIQRKRIELLFGFQYQIECYVPAAKRQYGYFCLPILWGDSLVGRVDLKANRKDKQLLVQNLVLQSDFKVDDVFLNELGKSLITFAAFHKCEERITVCRTTPKNLCKPIQSLLL
ncbi:MAG: crosslink repair DNA glycosylase YcaQ family protein [Spirochaetota bacterium]